MVNICWKTQIDQINILTFMDASVVEGKEKMWILVWYSCKKCFIKVNKKSLSFENALVRSIHKWQPFVDEINIFAFTDDLVVY